LAAALEKLPKNNDPRVLVGYNTADDAGVIRLNDELALVQTVDFFTPIVDDPYTYGQISAANSLSDVYAMGGRPFSALNIVGFPKDIFPLDVLAAILQGGQEKAAEADTPILGGHTISDQELKYGLAVTGIIHPGRILTNSGARAGDVLVLTKPIGTGTITTALKAGQGTPEMEAEVCRSMATLNRAAAEVCLRIGVNAVTDVTGFGLLGHALEMAEASDVGLVLRNDAVPLFAAAVATTAAGLVPGGTRANLLYAQAMVDFLDRISPEQRLLLCDPQTSGGLLIAVPEEKAFELVRAGRDEGVRMAVIGEVVGDHPGRIEVV
jgi:selenide,water dikinase